MTVYEFSVKVDGSAPLIAQMTSDEEPSNQRLKEAAATELDVSAELIEVIDVWEEQ